MTIDQMHSEDRRLFVFDMDGTLLSESTGCLALAQHFGNEDELRQLEELFASGDLTTREFAAEIFRLWGPIERPVIAAVFDQCRVMSRIDEALNRLHEAGHEACLITMSPVVFAREFERFGFRHIFASHYPDPGNAHDLDAVLTPADKPRIVEDLCSSLGLTTKNAVAFGDSGSDIPLFSVLENTVAVRASPNLRAIARHVFDGHDLVEAIEPFLCSNDGSQYA